MAPNGEKIAVLETKVGSLEKSLTLLSEEVRTLVKSVNKITTRVALNKDNINRVWWAIGLILGAGGLVKLFVKYVA